MLGWFVCLAMAIRRVSMTRRWLTVRVTIIICVAIVVVFGANINVNDCYQIIVIYHWPKPTLLFCAKVLNCCPLIKSTTYIKLTYHFILIYSLQLIVQFVNS